MGTSIKLNVGGLNVQFTQEAEIECAPIGKRESTTATAQQFLVKGAKGWQITVAFCRFSSTLMDVRTISFSGDAPEILHRLRSGLRMGVNIDAKHRHIIELSQAVPDYKTSPPWSNLKKANIHQLNKGAGFALDQELKKLGGNIGPRARIINDTSRRREYVCVQFHNFEIKIPLLSYIGTRVLPLLNLK